MYGIIYLWRVKPHGLAEHGSLMKAILQAERERCPELLLHLAFGPAADGTAAEIQVFSDETASRDHLARVAGEEPELARLRARREELREPDGSQTFPFEGMDGLADSFVRQTASIGFVEASQAGSGARLKGKVAIVTGGAQGNGKGIALAMAREGADIALVDLSRERAQAAAGEIEALGRRCLVIEADVSSEPAVQQFIATTVEQFGGLDILVNNAGIFPFKPIEQFTLAEFSRVLDVNLIAPWLCSKYAFPELKRRGGGAIVNITSCSGHYGGASVGGTAYDSSKGGLRQMTASLAAEFGPHQIRVNAIAPGVVVTEGTGGPKILESEGGKREMARTPLRRLGFPDDVGRVAAFLASDDASYVNGVTVILDGGAMAVW
jgi:NAD(P)-dependent dehydrogenase (short-subunit alcohol dehydrogenase family)